MRLLRSIPVLASVSAKFTADRGRMSVHDAGDVTLIVSSFEKNSNLVSFVLHFEFELASRCKYRPDNK